MEEKEPYFSITLNKDDYEYILKETFVNPKVFGLGKVSGSKITFQLSLNDIESIQGFIAAEANHAKDRKIGNELDRLFDIFQEYLDKYYDQEEI